MVDPIFPTDNEYGIPVLDSALQSTNIEYPALIWGAQARSRRMTGTWMFYCDDYRFESLWVKPHTVITTKCKHVIEPNFSVYDGMPKAHALWQTFRKRWLSRYWQDYGAVSIVVDMNVSREYARENLLGVPRGWRSYATRCYKERFADVEYEYALAQEHAGNDRILFIVYGGNREAREFAHKHGCVWINDQRTEARVEHG